MVPPGVSQAGKVLIKFRWKKKALKKKKNIREGIRKLKMRMGRRRGNMYRKVNMRDIAKMAGKAQQKFMEEGRS